MNRLEMTLAGSNAEGWRWAVSVDGVDVERTPLLAPEDLAEGLASIQRDADRRNAGFESVGDELLGLILEEFFSGELADVLKTSAEEQIWAKHLVSPALPTELSGALMFLIESPADDVDRLLRVEGGKTQAFRVARGRFDSLLRDVRARLDASE